MIDSLDVLNYDVCPEGWRMPSYEDWNTLLAYVDYDLLHSANGDPVGFGLETVGGVRGGEGWYRMTLSAGPSYLFTPRPTPEEFLQPGMPYVGNAMWSAGFVRCIKDD